MLIMFDFLGKKQLKNDTRSIVIICGKARRWELETG